MLPKDLAETLRNPAPEDTHGVVASDPDGGRQRLVYPIFGADNLHHQYGREFERTRNGDPQTVRVGKVLNPEEMFRQILLWKEIGVYVDGQGRQHPGKAVMQYSSGLLDVSVHTRCGVLELQEGRTFAVRLQSGEVVVPQNAADALSIQYEEGKDVWLWVGDDAVDHERRLLNPRVPENLLIVDSPTAQLWVLVPYTPEEGVSEFTGALVPVPHLPFVPAIPQDPGYCIVPEPPHTIAWVGPVANGEDPLVVSREQVEQLQEGTASDSLYNLVRNRAASYYSFREAINGGEAHGDALARLYGLHVRARISNFVVSAPSVLFGSESSG